MKFGIREVCDCTFTGKGSNSLNFKIDTAKMSTIESASTTVYAQGGRGFARLAAWEGEKTLTFTIEDAILTEESFQALLGKAKTAITGANRYTISASNFAGYYEVTAQTLWRDIDTGNDYAAIITIPKAKLQSNLNISMAPNGDPSTFTFTFDAFAQNGDFAYIDVATTATTSLDDTNTTVVLYKGAVRTTITTANTTPTITVNETGAITVPGATIPSTYSVSTAESLCNIADAVVLSRGSTTYTLTKGSTTYWYIL